MNDDRDGAVWLPTTPAVRMSVVHLVLRRGRRSRCRAAGGAADVVHVGGGTAGMLASVGVGVVGAGSAPPPPCLPAACASSLVWLMFSRR